VINMATARAIGAWPSWRVLTEAELINTEHRDTDRRITLKGTVREALEVSADLAVADADAVLTFFESQLGFSPDALTTASFGALPEAERDAITFATLFRTGLAQALLSDDFSFEPLTREELASFLGMAFEVRDKQVARTAQLDEVLGRLTPHIGDVVARWVDAQVDELGLALGRVQAYDLEPAFASSLLLTTGE
ncbi:MAG: DUF6178 family protein, partial [Myxococcota bacterium]|nr:DUF6178 family protein [Myxococcota bacterium]